MQALCPGRCGCGSAERTWHESQPTDACCRIACENLFVPCATGPALASAAFMFAGGADAASAFATSPRTAIETKMAAHATTSASATVRRFERESATPHVARESATPPVAMSLVAALARASAFWFCASFSILKTLSASGREDSSLHEQVAVRLRRRLLAVVHVRSE